MVVIDHLILFYVFFACFIGNTITCEILLSGHHHLLKSSGSDGEGHPDVGTEQHLPGPKTKLKPFSMRKELIFILGSLFIDTGCSSNAFSEPNIHLSSMGKWHTWDLKICKSNQHTQNKDLLIPGSLICDKL